MTALFEGDHFGCFSGFLQGSLHHVTALFEGDHFVTCPSKSCLTGMAFEKFEVFVVAYFTIVSLVSFCL